MQMTVNELGTALGLEYAEASAVIKMAIRIGQIDNGKTTSRASAHGKPSNVYEIPEEIVIVAPPTVGEKALTAKEFASAALVDYGVASNFLHAMKTLQLVKEEGVRPNPTGKGRGSSLFVLPAKIVIAVAAKTPVKVDA